MRLMVAVPTVDYVHAEFVKSLVGLCTKLAKDGVDPDVRVVSGTLVYVARNRLTWSAIEGGFTHILWLDSDMSFGPDILDDLLFCGKDMVCGAFVSRRPPYGPCVYASIDPQDIRKVEDFGTEPFRIAGCGFATVLTKVELMEKVMDRFGTCFTPTADHGEDLAFCKRVTDLGREIWCEPTVRPGHLAHIPVYAGGETPFGGERR